MVNFNPANPQSRNSRSRRPARSHRGTLEGLFWIVLISAALAFLLKVGCLGAAEIRPAGKVPEHSLIRVLLEGTEEAGVVSQMFTPVDVVTTPGLAIWTAPPGRYLVVISNPLKLIPVEIVAGGPQPTPPPGPGPDPPAPVPPGPVDNTYGVGQAAYDAALKANDPEGARRLADLFASGGSRLAALSGDVVDDINGVATTIANSMNAMPNIEKWREWRVVINEAYKKSWWNGQTRERTVGMMNETSAALLKAAGR